MLNRFILFVLVLVFSLPVRAQNEVVPQSMQQIQLSFAPVVKKVAPAVVNIYTKRLVSSGNRNPFMEDPFFRQFFGGGNAFGGQMRQHVESALGSGVIVEANGLVVTNAHVIQAAEEIIVVLTDGREYEAKVSLVDEASDLALLRIDAKQEVLPFVSLKPSESLEVGDLVLAIGNPFGVGQTVTSGIVSAQGRSSLDINDFNFFIQTDAAINPGNSGGPLVSLDGHVVGINSAIYSSSGGSLGIGFAIPSEMVATVIAAEKSGQTGQGRILRPWLGVGVQNITSEIASSLGLQKPGGALISELHTSSPLIAAGMKVGDIILQINGHEIHDSAEMKFRMATVPLGQSAKFKIQRGNRTLDVDVQAITPPDDPPRQETILKGRHPLNGVTVANINPAVAVELDIRGQEEGVVVIKTPRNMRTRFIEPGDILIEINGQQIKTVTDIQQALSLSEGQSGTALVILSGNRINKIFIR